MKLKLTIALLFPLFLNAQNATFESVFQTIKDRKENKNEISHITLNVKITESLIEINQIKEGKSFSVFSFPVNMETIDNNIYAYTDEQGSTAVFTTNEEKLVILNSRLVWVIYGKIPPMLKID